MRYHDWQLNRAVERRYSVAITRIMQGLQTELSRIRSPFLIAAAIRRYARSPTFRQAAEILARSMVTHVFSDGHKNWREAARAGSKGKAVYNALQNELSRSQIGLTYDDLISRNAELIRSMPLHMADQVTHMVSRKSQAGLRPEAIMQDVLRACPHLTKSHARLIARTESSKASTALTEARSREADLPWYVWRTGEDVRVRDSHRRMEGVLVNWDEPPSPEQLNNERKTYGSYHAGNIFNCRCYPEPLIMFSDVSWPHKVYYQGKIQMMTLAKFKRIAGGDIT